eukprot:scaffold147058_cov18-Tisochrysis_lutea.AAC.1
MRAQTQTCAQERMKLKKEAERVKKDAEDAERRTHEALKRKEQERKVAEAAVAEKKRWVWMRRD